MVGGANSTQGLCPFGLWSGIGKELEPGEVLVLATIPDLTVTYITPECLGISGYSINDFYQNQELNDNHIVHTDYKPLMEKLRQELADGDLSSREFDLKILTRYNDVKSIHVCMDFVDDILIAIIKEIEPGPRFRVVPCPNKLPAIAENIS